MSIIKSILENIKTLFKVSKEVNELKLLTASLLIETNLKKNIKSINEVEFKVYSQRGEDGIIQFLINKLPIRNEVFVEFGVEDYKEANTRYLLENNNWTGLVIEGEKAFVDKIKKSYIYWNFDITAKNMFITRENINLLIDEFIKENELDNEIGLLSIDIDGNDYHIWKCVNTIHPVIVICEYNWIFGNKYQLTVPYEENFSRTQKHFSNLYFGASINALYNLAKMKGYEYIGSNKAGNDAFFVRQDYAKQYIPELIVDPAKIFHKQKARESRDEKGKLTFLKKKKGLELIGHLNILDLSDNKIKKIREVL